MLKDLKIKIDSTWLTHREYIIGALIGFILGAIIF